MGNRSIDYIVKRRYPDVDFATGYYDVDLFDSIENINAIYSWHIMPPVREMSLEERREMLKAYVHFFNLNKIMLKGETNFHQYEGSLDDIKTHDIIFLDKIDKLSEYSINNFKSLMAILVSFSPTIYVGISETVRDRIYQHFEVLDYTFNSAGSKEFNEEQKKFAERVTKFINMSENPNILKKYFRPSSFFVKVTYLPNFSKENLETAEYYLNRTVKPKFGKR